MCVCVCVRVCVCACVCVCVSVCACVCVCDHTPAKSASSSSLLLGRMLLVDGTKVQQGQWTLSLRPRFFSGRHDDGRDGVMDGRTDGREIRIESVRAEEV